MNTTLLAVFVLAYLVGSIPFGVIFSRMFGLPDPRTVGSCGIGATNVLRSGHRGAALLTLIFDAGKGAAAVLLALFFLGEALALVNGLGALPGFPDTSPQTAAMIAGFGACVGHLFPLWLLFHGGKGVATFLGIFGALYWPAGLTAVGIWLVMAALFRISSLSALTMAAAMPFVLALYGQDGMVWLGVLLSVLLIFAHASNLERMFLGIEPKIGERKPA